MSKFQPGQSGNPNGRPPKAWTWASVVRQAMEEVENPNDRLAVKDKVAKALMAKAQEGDVSAIKEIGDRIDGKALQKNDITTAGQPINPTITVLSDLAKENLEKLYEGSTSSNE